VISYSLYDISCYQIKTYKNKDLQKEKAMKITVGSKVWSCLDYFGAESYDRPNTPWFGEVFAIGYGTILIKLISDIKVSSGTRAFLFFNEKDVVKNDLKTDLKNDLGLESRIDLKSDAKIDLKRGEKNDVKNKAEFDVINGTKDDTKNDQVWIETDKLFATEKECWIEYKRLLEEHLSLANDAVNELKTNIESAQRKIDEIG
jgi:hypothetical protein